MASSEFQQELTTTVLWLNKQGLDIRCVQMRPHLIEDRVLLDIHQVIPLPEAAQYQVAVREKSMEQDAARVSDRDTTRYDLSIGDASFSSLPKRRLIYEIVAEALRQRVPATGIAEAVPWRGNVFATADGQLDEAALQTVLGTKRLRYFTADDDLFHVDGNTYALSNQWGARTLEAIENILRLMPNKELVSYSPATALTDEVVYGEYLIRQCESGAIEVEQDGTQVQPVKPVLRKLAEQLGVPLQNANGNNLNTRQLGVQVMNAIRSQ